MNLNFKTSMIFDAICACNLISYPGKHNKATQYEFLKIMKERTGEIFNEGALSYSTMCNIVARYIADPSCADLDDLYTIIDPGIYRTVFDGDVDCSDLEEVYITHSGGIDPAAETFM